MHPKSKEFLTLQAEWYAKLQGTGFKDAEQLDGNLKEWHSFAFPRITGRDTIKARAEYYVLAGNFLYDYKFETPRDRLVWAMHAEGMSEREIASKITTTKYHSKSLVHTIIFRLAKIMVNQWKK